MFRTLLLGRLFIALILSVVAFAVGVFGFIEFRQQVCAPIDLLPGVTCPPVTVPATTAATVVLGLAVAVVVSLAVVKRSAKRAWRRAVIDAHTMFDAPFSWSFASFLQWVIGLSAVIVAAILTAQIQNFFAPPELRWWPVILLGGLILVAGMTWSFWRCGRLQVRTGFRFGIPFAIRGGVVGTYDPSVPESGPSRGRSDSAGGRRPRGPGFGGAAPVSSGWEDSSSGGWGAGSGSSNGYPRDGPYGDGPQHGTRSLADERGSFYGSDHRDLRPPAEQPGNLYSRDPFGD